MRNEHFKKTAVLLLACIMTLTLAACGSSASSGTSASNTSAAGGTPANEYKYVSSFTPIKDAEFDSLTSIFYTEDGFYAAANYYGNTIRCIPVFIGYDGSIKEFSAYTSPASDDNANGRANYSTSDNIIAVRATNDGKLLVIVTVYEYWNDDPEITRDDPAFFDSYQYAQKTLACFLDADGKETAAFEFDIEENDYILNTAVAADNSILIVTSTGLYAYSQEGQQLWKAKTEEAPENVIPMADGHIYFTANGSEGFALYPVDEKTHEAGKAIKLPGSAEAIFAGDEKHDFYYSSGSNFYAFDLEAAEPTKLLSWLELDVTTNMYNPVYVTKDGSIRGYINENTYGEVTVKDYKVFQIDEVPASAVKEKKQLILATLGLEYESEKQVIKFNRASEDYHITIKDYAQYANGNDLSAGVLKLQTEILAGNSPDIIDLNNIAVDRLAAKGLLEDLYPYIDADAELKREDFLPSILAAAENNGKLVSTVSGFRIMTLAGASDIVGEQPGWTYDEFNAALAMMPEGCTALSPATTRKDILDNCLTLDLNHYVNWATGECKFECKEFTDLLNFAMEFPASYDSSLEDPSYGEIERMISGMQMLMPFSLDALNSTWTGGIIFGNHPYTYIGYPTYSGESGNYINMSAGYAMSAGCKEKQGAWEFLRTFFTESYQRSCYNIPSNKAAFDAKLKYAMTMQYETDDKGSYVLDENGEKIPRAVFQYFNGTDEFKYYALSQEEADTVISLIENTKRNLEFDVSILSIVEEQAEAFFQGQKSAEEVARLIQSKVNIYVNEQR